MNHHLRPNHELTDQERSEKRGLKRLLKRQTRRRKLENRLHQAIMRKDTVTEESSRRELAQFLQQEEHESLKTHSLGLPIDLPVSVSDAVVETPTSQQTEETCPKLRHQQSQQEEARARGEIEEMYINYLKILKDLQQEQQNNTGTKGDDNSSSAKTQKTTKSSEMEALTPKEQQIIEARLLLLSMTKGTQTVDMFENQTALMGYIRQKFQERASLALSSLCKLDPRRERLSIQAPSEIMNVADTLEKQHQLWNRLVSSSVRSICSIGCGPGCDATGLVKFFEHFAQSGSRESDGGQSTGSMTIIDRIVFLDWTMDKWGQFLRPLVDNILAPNKYVASADLAICDVLRSLSDDSNKEAQELLLRTNNPGSSDIDLFVTSYLLTEQRGKWHAFYRDIIEIAKQSAMFLFAEPNSWQLHILMEQNAEKMDFVWLDSSMNNPILQPLEGRIGPAVLLGIKL